MGAIECYQHAQKKDFQHKVKYYMQTAALAIIGEDGETAGHTERLAYAIDILSGDANIKEFSIGVVTNSTIAATINMGNEPSDSDIEFTVNSMINDFAGYDG